MFPEAFSSDIRNDVFKRLIHGGNLAPRNCDRARAKLAVLLLVELNPKECLTHAEAALMYGLSENGLRVGKSKLYNKVNS